MKLKNLSEKILRSVKTMGFKYIEVWDDDMLEEHNLSSTSWSEDFLNKLTIIYLSDNQQFIILLI